MMMQVAALFLGIGWWWWWWWYWWSKKQSLLQLPTHFLDYWSFNDIVIISYFTFWSCAYRSVWRNRNQVSVSRSVGITTRSIWGSKTFLSRVSRSYGGACCRSYSTPSISVVKTNSRSCDGFVKYDIKFNWKPFFLWGPEVKRLRRVCRINFNLFIHNKVLWHCFRPSNMPKNVPRNSQVWKDEEDKKESPSLGSGMLRM